jgi:hypothetical protein
MNREIKKFSLKVPNFGRKQLQIYETGKIMNIWKNYDALERKMPLRMLIVTKEEQGIYRHVLYTRWG